MAEGEGFEPPVRFPVQWFSRPPVSTAHASLREIDDCTGFFASLQQGPRNSLAPRIQGDSRCAWYLSLIRQPERPGMELHYFCEVGEKIGQAVIAGVKMILVLDPFFLQ